MNGKRYDALQDCLTALEQGAQLGDVLALYPEFAHELQSLLETAESAKESARFDIPSEVIQRSRTRLLGRATQFRDKSSSRRWFGLPRFAYSALTAAFVVFISAGALVTASAQALPGDALYPVKRGVEGVRYSFASGDEIKRSLQAEYKQRRIDETIALFKLGRTELVTFEGVVSEKATEFWVIDDIRTLVTLETTIEGLVEIGMGVEVIGEVQPGDWVEAKTITLRTYQFYGTVEEIHADRWVIDGVSFKLDELALLDADLEVGDFAVVLVRVDDVDELTALAILEADDDAGSDGEDSPSETETQESATEEDDIEPEGTDDSETETPDLTHETDETGTPEPDETDEDDDTPETDEPDETPKPDEIPDD